MTQFEAFKKMLSHEHLAEPPRKENPRRIWGGSLTLVIVVATVLVGLAPGTSAQYTESGAWMGLENNTVVNVSAQLASTAFLPCSVRMIGDKQISWIRRRDWHVLTSGIYTYTNDERFSITHRDGADDWTLSIKFLQKRDNGTYECQISTGTGIISQFVNVYVIVPEAFILGNSEFHIQTGSAINLYCIIEQSPIPPQYVYWKHNNRVLNYDKERGGVSVIMEHGTKTSSRLIIYGATTADSGNYTCGAPSTEPATVNVFVSQGDKTAAIQRRTSGTKAALSPNNVLHVLFISSLLLLQFLLHHHLLTQVWVLPPPSITTSMSFSSPSSSPSSSYSSSLLSSLLMFLSFSSPRKS